MRTKLKKKTIHHKFGLNDKIKNIKTFRKLLKNHMNQYY